MEDQAYFAGGILCRNRAIFMEKNWGLFNSTRGHDTFACDCQYSNFHLASTWQIYDEFARKRIFTAFK